MRKLLLVSVVTAFTMTSISAQTKAVKANPLGVAFGLEMLVLNLLLLNHNH